MNLSKIISSGAVFTKYHQSLPFFRAVNDIKWSNPSGSSFFSYFFNAFGSPEANKLIQTPFSAIMLSVRGYKVRGHLQLRCKDCYMVRKDGELQILCSSYPRHKQKKLSKRRKYTWILTHACQSKLRPY